MDDSSFTHMNEQGRAHMVDVSDKPVTTRRAVTQARVRMDSTTLQRIREGRMVKGDVLSVAQVAGIMAAKKTADIIPMCHPISLTSANIHFGFEGDETLVIEAEVKTDHVTGVEMEALVAVSVAAMTVYDMCKSMDRSMVVEETLLVYKSGGKSGDFRRTDRPLLSR
jgi:cyclic pyranopterin phosphate synthase